MIITGLFHHTLTILSIKFKFTIINSIHYYSFVNLFRYLYASSIKLRKIIMIIDHGATSINSESLDLTKAFGKEYNISKLINRID